MKKIRKWAVRAVGLAVVGAVAVGVIGARSARKAAEDETA